MLHDCSLFAIFYSETFVCFFKLLPTMARLGDQSLRSVMYQEAMLRAYEVQQAEAERRREMAYAVYRAEREARRARQRRALAGWTRFFIQLSD